MQRTTITRWLSIGLALLLLAGLSACDAFGGGEAPVPIEVGELSETYTGEDSFGGEISVNYPAGWVQSGDASSLILANSNNLLEDNLDADDDLGVALMPGMLDDDDYKQNRAQKMPSC